MLDVIALSHSLLVHFSIALFLFSVIAYLISYFSKGYYVKHQAGIMARWALWIGAFFTLITSVVGFFSSIYSGHDDFSHVLVKEHRNLALLLTIVILVLALWGWVLYQKESENLGGFVFFQSLAGIAMVYVMWSGSVLVFQHGIGVKSLPDIASHQHRLFELKESEKEEKSFFANLLSP